MDKQSKDQIKKCIVDLAERCKELGDNLTYASLLVVAASMADNSEEMLAVWLREYAKLRMQILDSELKGNKDDDDSIDYPKLDLN
jgi:hypothetical protein